MPFEGNRGSSSQSMFGQQLGAPIYQWGAAHPYGPYSGLPGAGTPATGGSTTTATSTTPAAGPNEGEAWYKSVLSGGKLPFNPATKANMVSRASDMTAAAEGANNQRNASVAAAGGASANDPSYQAAQLANQANRQTANQTAVRDIDTETEKANFGAEAEAANALNQNAMQRESYAHQQANQASNQAMSFLPWNQSGNSGSSGGGSHGGNNFNLPQQRQDAARQDAAINHRQDLIDDMKDREWMNQNAGNYDMGDYAPNKQYQSRTPGQSPPIR